MAMKPLAAITLTFLLSGSACSQTPQRGAGDPARPASRSDLYQCEGCEATTERSADGLGWRAALAPDGEPGERLVLSGRVLLPGGEAPASGVVLYFHQTNARGFYPAPAGATGWARRHGDLRGWLVTDAAGRYEIDTVRPAPYPGLDTPAHIHVFVKEPGRRPYYIDDVTFEGDPFLTSAYRQREEGRGGSGIVQLTRGSDGAWRGRRDVTLEW